MLTFLKLPISITFTRGSQVQGECADHHRRTVESLLEENILKRNQSSICHVECAVLCFHTNNKIQNNILKIEFLRNHLSSFLAITRISIISLYHVRMLLLLEETIDWKNN